MVKEPKLSLAGVQVWTGSMPGGNRGTGLLAWELEEVFFLLPIFCVHDIEMWDHFQEEQKCSQLIFILIGEENLYCLK